ncbi:MAG TPA: pirin family protein [Steroidobacteraceae bacterium]|nr:pirin family protein [Steroidobacteraceae bacterium]
MLERIESRASTIGGGLTIRRALPNARRRTVGAWCFLDHAGPLEFPPGEGLRVGPHPHIGLQTFTWMIEGEVVHRDSLGNEQLITPGQVNLMTAGGGISHAEDSAATQGRSARLHAVQLWIALPDAHRHRAPSFRNHADLPRIEAGGFTVCVLAGSALGHSSPAEIFSPLVGLDLSAPAAGRLSIPMTASYEHAALVLEGAATVAGEQLAPGTLLYIGTGRDSIDISCRDAARLILIGGVPFQEEILLWWNFVARRPEEMQEATRDWNAGKRFGSVLGSPSVPLIAPNPAGLSLRASPPQSPSR